MKCHGEFSIGGGESSAHTAKPTPTVGNSLYSTINILGTRSLATLPQSVDPIFLGAICGTRPITSLTRRCSGLATLAAEFIRYVSPRLTIEKSALIYSSLIYLSFIIYGLLILLPPIAIWCSVSKQASGRVAWIQPALALIGPFIAAFVVNVLMWLPTYSGRCGGWLGETTPCRFGQYATEAMFWAAMSMAMPALLGILLGVVVLIVGLIRRDRVRSAVTGAPPTSFLLL